MSQAETSLASVKPRIAPPRETTTQTSGSAAVNVGVLAAADRGVRSDGARRGGLEEQLGPRRLVDLVVDAEPFLAEVGAAPVGDAGAPHLGRHDRNGQRVAAGLAGPLQRGPVDRDGSAGAALLVEPARQVQAITIDGGQQVEGRGEAGLAGGDDVGAIAGEGAGAQAALRVENLEQSHVNRGLKTVFEAGGTACFRSATPPTAAAATW